MLVDFKIFKIIKTMYIYICFYENNLRAQNLFFKIFMKHFLIFYFKMKY